MYGLKRIVLHNSYFSGLSVLFDADGHSNASGGNGAGKTSALNLIPIFYGTEPNQLVDQIADKDSFIDFYLPKQSSALIYEHLREDGKKLVVMYRHSSGTKTMYRFVSGSLEETFFNPTISPLLDKGTTITHVFHALRDMGIRVSRQVDTITDYRALIQNDRKLLRRKVGKNSQDLAIAREYCLGGPNDHMSHLDRMSHAILRRTDMFDRLKKMIAETQFNDIHIDDRPEHLRDKTLIEDIAGVKDFEAAEQRIRMCIEQHHQRKLVISDRDVTASQLKSICLEAMKTAQVFSQHCEELEIQLKALNDTYREESKKLRETHEGLKIKTQTLNDEIEVIYAKNEVWVDWGVVERQALYSNLDHHIERKSLLESDLAMLTQKVEHLDRAREQSQFKARENRDKAFQQINKQKLSYSEEKGALIRKFADNKSEIESRKHKELTLLSTGDSVPERQGINNQMIEAQHLANSQHFSEEDQVAIHAFEDQIEKISVELEEESLARNQTEAERDKLETAHEQALIAHQHALAETKRLEENYDAIHALIFPKDGSLLSELRLLNPEWIENVGKVISPELLKRTDLQPEYQTGLGKLLYGWSLDLEKINPPDHVASEDSLTARLDEAETRLRNSRQICEERENYTADLFSQLQPFKTKLTEIKHRLYQLKEEQRQLEGRKKGFRREAKDRAKERQMGFSRKSELFRKELKAFDERIELRRAGIENTFEEMRLEIEAREQTSLNEIDAKIEQLTQDLEWVIKDYEERLTQIGQRFTEECEREGVDSSQIRAVREILKVQLDRVEEIEGYRIRLQEYEHWYKTYWERVPEKEKAYADLKVKCASAEEDIHIHNRKHTKKISGLKTQLDQNHNRLTELNKQSDQANQIISRCPVTNLEIDTPSASLEDLTEKVTRLLSEEYGLRKQVSKGVESAQFMLSKYVNSRIYKAWSSLLEVRRANTDVDEYSESFRLNQPDDLAHLLDKDLPAIRDLLIQQVRAVGDSLSKYHDCLKGLNDEVTRVSRHLGNRLNTKQRIENLTNIQLQISSVVVEGDYWDKLSSFNQQWREWQDGRDIELPPESLLHAIQISNEALQSARIGSDLNSLIRLRISLEENGRKAHVSNAKEFDALSSNGLSYLAILVIFMGMARYLCPNEKISLHWPIDELAALSPENIAKLFHMFEESGIYCFSAFPSTDPNLLKFFKHRKLIDRKVGIRNLIEQPFSKPNVLKEKLAAMVVEEA
jgi:hypothetical protein